MEVTWKALPGHTLRYFAAEQYRLWMYRAIKASKRRTVQGIELHTRVEHGLGVVVCEWTDLDGKSRNKEIKIAKSWL